MKQENETQKEEKMVAESKERYVNPYTDFGFKKLFGTELNKDLLISFLNALFGGEIEISDVTFLNSEHLGDGYGDRRAVYDVYCDLIDGRKQIVEMQKAEQEFFKDRSVFYATYPIREQAPQGKWDYHLKDVYTVGLLNFVFPDNEYPSDSYRHEVKLKDVEDNHVFYDKLTFIYLEMPKFNKTEDELETMFDKWMYALRNMTRLLERPKALQERIFTRLFEQAEIARFTPKERREYGESVKDYWDYYSTVKTAHKKGLAEGEAIGIEKERQKNIKEKLESAKRLKQSGVPIEVIAKSLNLDETDIVRDN